jgi:hypothetical protein
MTRFILVLRFADRLNRLRYQYLRYELVFLSDRLVVKMPNYGISEHFSLYQDFYSISLRGLSAVGGPTVGRCFLLSVLEIE